MKEPSRPTCSGCAASHCTAASGVCTTSRWTGPSAASWAHSGVSTAAGGAVGGTRRGRPAGRTAGSTSNPAASRRTSNSPQASSFGVPVTVVMPRFAPLIKVTNCRALGATVILHGDDVGHARERAAELAAERGLAFVHPFDNADVVAGQGTMALEILEQTPDVEAIVVPVGGGGLISGIGLVAKAKKPTVEIVGVEPENAPSLAAAFARHGPVQVALSPTLADGLAVAKTGEINYPIARRVVDRLCTVDEASIALAILRLIELEKSVVEGAGATPLAAFIAGKLPHLEGRTVVLTLCGGNIDTNMLGRVLDIGLVADGRLSRFTVSVLDRPGGLARLTSVIAATGASIHELAHDRAFSGPNVAEVRVICVVETTGTDHVRALHGALREAGFAIVG